MNERIKELAEQLEFPIGLENPQWAYEPALYKFAELIVKECCQALHPMLRDQISRGQGVDLIKKHFGVDE